MAVMPSAMSDVFFMRRVCTPDGAKFNAEVRSSSGKPDLAPTRNACRATRWISRCFGSLLDQPIEPGLFYNVILPAGAPDPNVI